jgi:hypothetical protein
VIQVRTFSEDLVLKNSAFLRARRVLAVVGWCFLTCVSQRRFHYNVRVTKASSTHLALFQACELSRRRGRQNHEWGKLGSASHFITKAGEGPTASHRVP